MVRLKKLSKKRFNVGDVLVDPQGEIYTVDDRHAFYELGYFRDRVFYWAKVRDLDYVDSSFKKIGVL